MECLSRERLLFHHMGDLFVFHPYSFSIFLNSVIILNPTTFYRDPKFNRFFLVLKKTSFCSSQPNAESWFHDLVPATGRYLLQYKTPVDAKPGNFFCHPFVSKKSMAFHSPCSSLLFRISSIIFSVFFFRFRP